MVMNFPSKTGFTLIELMIVIAVMAVMITIAAPTFQTYMAQSRLKGAAREVASDLMAARMQAIKENNKFKVSFIINDHQYTILDDDNNNGTADSGETTQTKDIQTTYHDVTIENYTNNPIFLSNGTATNLTTVTLSNSTGSRDVTVAITGRVKIDDSP
jgi:type IV fimbrial biogenesis protein FimT